MEWLIDEYIQYVEGETEDSRNADRSVEGYLYQFELTLLHILKDKDKAIKPLYKIEKIEDYTTFTERDGKIYIEVAQIKNHTSKVSKSTYYKAILWMYYGFLKHKSLNKQNIEYKAVLYHSDEKTTTFKIEDVLTDAMNNKSGMKLDAYKKVVDLCKESDDMKNEFSKIDEFSKITRFSKSKNRVDLVSEIEEELFILYSHRKKEYENKKLLYAFAISKIIDHSLGVKAPVSFEIFDNYMCSEQPTVNEAFFIKRIEQKILELIDKQIEMLDVAKNPPIDSYGIPTITTKTHKDYKMIYKLIFSFISEKIQNPVYRKSFLNTVTTGNMQPFLSSTEKEYQIFLENGEYIRSFIACLAKIIYQYQKINAKKVKLIHLNKWFEINEFVWIFRHPSEKRDSGYLIGEFNQKGYEYMLINSVIQRLENVQTKPNVWYWKSPNQIIASDMKFYKHDTSKVDPKHSPGNEYFYIQCLGCLEVDMFESIDKVENIFNFGCVKG
ncbi:hypothetical protein [Gottfriedia acidiceleris]|uniref:Uncharacterized protein n=1 Tax=Gottfriedia acidiceleris TaxID=371036 RepID=A0ABY4JVM7_9BACI|nr:hypothetical protein [Gottfriedia acidiceleris]UPM56375.1 hypothetical protein MY490_11285 [Gottfriedia acidiceleris]